MVKRENRIYKKPLAYNIRLYRPVIYHLPVETRTLVFLHFKNGKFQFSNCNAITNCAQKIIASPSTSNILDINFYTFVNNSNYLKLQIISYRLHSLVSNEEMLFLWQEFFYFVLNFLDSFNEFGIIYWLMRLEIIRDHLISTLHQVFHETRYSSDTTRPFNVMFVSCKKITIGGLTYALPDFVKSTTLGLMSQIFIDIIIII